jgi:hypothetical protein
VSKGALFAIGLAALAACAPPNLPEGQYLGLVAKRETVEVRPPAARGVRAEASRAYVWTVKLDGGRWMTVEQAEPKFANGQRVRINTGDGPPRMEIP